MIIYLGPLRHLSLYLSQKYLIIIYNFKPEKTDSGLGKSKVGKEFKAINSGCRLEK